MGSLFLAKLLGIYFIIVGLIAVMRKRSVMPMVADLYRHRGVLLIVAFLELVAGIALVLTYPGAYLDWMGVISFVGWMMIVESMLLLLLPARSLQKFIKKFNHDSWYVGGGILSIFLGLYLAWIGFGFI